MRLVPQLSVFTPNKKGALEHITNILVSKGINIAGLTTHDAFEYAVIRLIVSDPDEAEKQLKNANIPGIIRSDVLEVELPDEPGTLHTTVRKIADHGVNIGYVYATSGKGTSIVYIACDDLQKAMESLQ
jgi:hypothetical protein